MIKHPIRATALVVFSLAAGLLHADTTSPNVLLICVDDLKPTIGCFGDPIAITPNIDRLAARAVRFDMAYCNQAVCSPSRNSLMTGLRPQTIGVYDLPTHFRLAAPDAVTLSQYFKDHGYHAAGLGKIFHTGHGNKDDKLSWSVPSWRPSAASYVVEQNLAAIRPDAKGKRRGPATESADVPDETYADGLVAGEAIKRLESFKEEPKKPFFLAVGFVKPHLPFVAPQHYWDLYEPAALPMPEIKSAPKDAPSYAKTTSGELRNYSDMPNEGAIDESTTRHLIHGYYAATSYADAQIGKVLETLDRLELADNTIVALWGDHGWHLGDHGMWCKHTNYEQAARIPVIVAPPNSSPSSSPNSSPSSSRGFAASTMIETVDLYPTLCDLAGLPIPKTIDGRSFANVIRNSSASARDYVTHVYPRGNRLGRAIRNPRYRMVEWKVPGELPDTAEIELYDYQNDPLETKNIASESPAVVAEMRAELAQQPEAKKQWKSR